MSAQSDAAGRFAFTGVPAGEYQIQVRRPGFVGKQGRVTLARGQRVEREVSLHLGTLQETVIVRSASAESAPVGGPERVASGPPPSAPCDRSASVDCITAPTKLVHMKPVYPKEHTARGVGGRVVVEGRIGPNGRLEDLQPEAGSDPALAAATLEALRLWQYSPAKFDGVPVACAIVVAVTFEGGLDWPGRALDLSSRGL